MCTFSLRLLHRFRQAKFGFQKAVLCVVLLYVKVEDALVYRHTATANEKGAAGCEAAESAQQTGVGGPEHLPCAQ